MRKALPVFVLVTIFFSVQAQKIVVPDISKINNSKVWAVYNRNAIYTDAVHLDSNNGDGIVRLLNFDFENGKVELDIKGQNKPGGSFAGFAFHGLNDSTYDAVYFRAFNFKNPERKTHSVQYISHPQHPWFVLRENFPDKYENAVDPVPDPDDWFHVTIIVDHPSVKVFVNNTEKPSLVVDQLSARKKGWIGFWVGNTSEGDFNNLRITKK
jgi:hypothetical protein